MADLPFFSSQGSQSENHAPVQLPSPDDLASSPLRSRSEAATLKSSSLKPRKPPTVTPKRFNKFFTPRPSLSGRGGSQSKAGRQLRDITRNAVNRRKSAPLGGNVGEEFDDLLSSRPLKRRKQSFDVPSSPPASSPLRRVEPGQDQIDVLEDDVTTPMALDYDDDNLSDMMETMQPFPTPIRRLRPAGRTQRILERSFGGYDTSSRGWRGSDHCGDWRTDTADFVSAPTDQHSFRGTALPFCTAACNTAPLVALADEEGRVRLLDPSTDAKFQKSHVSFKVHRNAIMDLVFSSDDYMLATASGDQTARVIDMHTQQTMYILSGHNGSVKQVRFHPNDDKMLTTSSRDGSVQIWDLRCSSKTSTQILRPAYASKADSQTLYSKFSMDIGPAHRTVKGKISRPTVTSSESVGGASITAFQHLKHGREYLLATASEANASIKLWDLRNAGRRGAAAPLSSTPIPGHHKRDFGVSALALSGDGSRLYSVCRDSIVYTYATNHLVSGCAPEMSTSYSGRRAARDGRMGAAPLYGLRHPSLRVGTFYVRASLRPAKGDKSEILAIGSSDKCPVLFPTDERHLRHRNNRLQPALSNFDEEENEDDEAELPTLPPPSSQPAQRADLIKTSLPIHEHGTALVRAHSGEVTSVSFTSDNNLISIGDDYRARCWRENREQARHLRQCGEGGGQRWASGWADMGEGWDGDEEE